MKQSALRHNPREVAEDAQITMDDGLDDEGVERGDGSSLNRRGEAAEQRDKSHERHGEFPLAFPQSDPRFLPFEFPDGSVVRRTATDAQMAVAAIITKAGIFRPETSAQLGLGPRWHKRSAAGTEEATSQATPTQSADRANPSPNS